MGRRDKFGAIFEDDGASFRVRRERELSRPRRPALIWRGPMALCGIAFVILGVTVIYAIAAPILGSIFG